MPIIQSAAIVSGTLYATVYETYLATSRLAAYTWDCDVSTE